MTFLKIKARRQAVLLAAMASCLAAATSAGAAQLSLTSPAFEADGAVPARFTCDAAGVSPPLKFTHVPASARSLALTLQDPDAPAGVWTHWVVYNLPADTQKLPANMSQKSLPKGAAVANNSYRHPSYGAICPPRGSHHYVFTLYALDKDLPKSLHDIDALKSAIKGHVIDKTTLTATYTRAYR